MKGFPEQNTDISQGCPCEQGHESVYHKQIIFLLLNWGKTQSVT